MYLPRWPLQNLWRGQPELRDKPVAIVQRQARGATVVVCCARAAQAGVRPGMPLAEAQTIQKQLVVWDEDPTGDRDALERLAEWAQRYSPIVGLEEAATVQSLLLDISGCAACFHGEDRLAQQAVRELRAQGWIAHVAIAGTIGAAWGLAHTVRGLCIVPPEETEQALAPLPLAALRLPAEAIETLGKLGIERIGQLASLPRASVPGRFGALVLQRLDQALGRLPELIVPHQPLPEVQASCSFTYPTDRREVLSHAVDLLLERIEATLRSRNRGARRLECWLYHETAAPCRVEAALFRPSDSARRLGKLLHTQLEEVQIAEPVSRLALRVPAVEIMAERQFELFEADPCMEELGDLIDRLASQLGRDAVTFARLVEDPQPEHACRFEPAIEHTTSQQRAEPTGTLTADAQRPLQMWPVPLPVHVLAVFPAGAPFKFLWMNKEYTVTHCWGPERIETGWWRGCDIHRDYYRVETHVGARLWLFRQHEDNCWFLHGAFD